MKVKGNFVVLTEEEYNVYYSLKAFVSALRRPEMYEVNETVKSQADFLMKLYGKHVDLMESVAVRDWYNKRQDKKEAEKQNKSLTSGAV